MMDNVISLIASSIASAEGFFVNGALPQRNNNPGDLRAAPWLVHPAVVGGFWRAETLAQGIAGMYHQIALDIARGWTLRQLITSWAPASDGNNTDNYVNETARRTGLDPDAPLWSFFSIENIP